MKKVDKPMGADKRKRTTVVMRFSNDCSSLLPLRVRLVEGQVEAQEFTNTQGQSLEGHTAVVQTRTVVWHVRILVDAVDTGQGATVDTVEL